MPFDFFVSSEGVTSTPTADRYSRADVALIGKHELSGNSTFCGGLYCYLLMNEITKDPTEEKNSQMLVVRKQDGAKVELAKSNALVVYEKQEVAREKKGFFRKPRRKSTSSHGQLVQLLLKNIETFSEDEVQLFRAIFDLKTLTVQEVMIPLSEISPLTVESPCSEISKYCRASNYCYIPVYNERVDQLLGVIDAMEALITEQHDGDLSRFIREVRYVPTLKSALDLLNELRQSEIPAAIVVNEHGSCVGIVELMDILEKVVGEITANRKRDMPRVEQLSSNEWHIDARALISEVNMTLDTEIPTDQCDTIGGFILMLLGRLPQTGEKVEYEDFEFNIDQVFKYRISGIRATKKTVGRTRR